jgi:hypothetical protein
MGKKGLLTAAPSSSSTAPSGGPSFEKACADLSGAVLIRRTASRLTRSMVADGMLSHNVNVDPTTGERVETGGLAVTRAPFHVVDGRGRPDPDVYALGVATDRTRWFTHSSRAVPGQDSPFCRNADAIAADILAQFPVAPAAYVAGGGPGSVRLRSMRSKSADDRVVPSER